MVYQKVWWHCINCPDFWEVELWHNFPCSRSFVQEKLPHNNSICISAVWQGSGPVILAIACSIDNIYLLSGTDRWMWLAQSWVKRYGRIVASISVAKSLWCLHPHLVKPRGPTNRSGTTGQIDILLSGCLVNENWGVMGCWEGWNPYQMYYWSRQGSLILIGRSELGVGSTVPW